MEWQPIETAPKDGRGILLFYYPKQGMAFAFWADEAWFECSPCLGIEKVFDEVKPTHWMPLTPAPEPPK